VYYYTSTILHLVFYMPKNNKSKPTEISEEKFLPELIELFATTKNNDDMSKLLGAILTPEELQQIVKRWQIVKLLLSGATVRDTAKILKISVEKVSRGSRELKYGNNIFQKLFKKLSKKK